MLRRPSLIALLVVLHGCNTCEVDPVTEAVCAFTVRPHDVRPGEPAGPDTGPVAFGEVRKGSSRERTITIDNTGESNVQLTDLKVTLSELTSTSYSIVGDIPVVNPGATATITFSFSPAPISGEVGNTVTITHPNIDNATCPTFTVTLLGRALPPLPPDAGEVDAAVDAGEDAGEPGDAGRDAGMVFPIPDAGVPLDGGQFEVRGGLQDARSEFGAALLPSGEILVVGGFDYAGQALRTAEIYNPYTHVSRRVASMQDPRARHSVTVLADGKIVAYGGVSSGAGAVADVLDSLEIYNPAMDTWSRVTTGQKRAGHIAVQQGNQILVAYGWTQMMAGQAQVPASGAFLVDAMGSVTMASGDMSATRARLGAAVVDMGDGSVLFAGGLEPVSGGILDEVVRYSAGAMNVLPTTLGHHRAFATGARFANGPVVITGGADNLGPITTAERMDVVMDMNMWEFVDVAGETGVRLNAEAVRVLDDVILVTGGHGPLPADGGVLALQDAELFIHVQSLGVLSAGTVNDMSVPRVFPEAVPFDGGIAFLGGSATMPRRSARPDVETYFPVQNRFETAGLIGPGGAATGAAPQKLFVAGGIDLSTGRASARTRVYDIEAKVFSEGPTLLVARTDATATISRDDGSIIIVGGTSANGDPLTHVEKMRGDLSFSEPMGSLTQGRRRHTATELLDGKVLVCGGLGAGASPLDSCELFNPMTSSFTAVTGRMVRGRYDHTATLLDDGRVLLVGGNDPALGAFKADIYDPADNTLHATMGRPQQARRGHAAVLVGAGRVLIAGGETFNGSRVATDTAELFDAVSEQFDELPPMEEVREGAAAFLFLGGNVVITGGGQPVTNDPDFPTRGLTRTEVYEPAALPLGDFRGFDAPLNFPRARAVGEQTITPLVLFGEGRHGIVAPGVEARVPLTTIEEFTQ